MSAGLGAMKREAFAPSYKRRYVNWRLQPNAPGGVRVSPNQESSLYELNLYGGTFLTGRVPQYGLLYSDIRRAR